MSGYYLDQDGSGPLCPYAAHVVPNAQHRAWTGVQNLTYSQVSHLLGTADEMPEEAQREYERIIRLEALKFDITVPDQPLAHYEMDHMRLYVSGSTVSYTAQTERGTDVEAFYFQCRVCGFVLPANRVRR